MDQMNRPQQIVEMCSYVNIIIDCIIKDSLFYQLISISCIIMKNMNFDPTTRRPALIESWASRFKELGMPERLITLVRQAEFEEWSRQQSHQRGDGLFYTEEFEDLPPRFRKKILKIVYEMFDDESMRENIVSKLTQPSTVKQEKNVSDEVMGKQKLCSPPPQSSSSPVNQLTPRFDKTYTKQESYTKPKQSNNVFLVNSISCQWQDKNNLSFSQTSQSRGNNSQNRKDKSKPRNVSNDRGRNSRSSNIYFDSATNSSNNFRSDQSYESDCSSQNSVFTKFPNSTKKKTHFDSNKLHFESSHRKQFKDKGIFQEAVADTKKLSNGEHNLELRDVFNEKKICNSTPEQTGNEFANLEVKVSDMAENVKFWTERFQEILDCDNFEISIVGRQILCIKFCSPEAGRQALRDIQRKKRILQAPRIIWAKPQIEEHVNGIVKETPKNNCDVKSTIRSCWEEVVVKFQKTDESHKNRINLVQDELQKMKQNVNSQELADPVDVELSTLKNMETVFHHFVNRIKEQFQESMNSDTLPWKLKQLKNRCIRECMFLEGRLPIYSERDTILDTVKENPVSVIIAETGSGKSSQITQYLCHSEFSSKGSIICTQPRKIAAISICKHISSQMGTAPGEFVGYDIGMRKKINVKYTKIIYMTDHALLRHCMSNPNLNDVSCIIVDEAHERSLYTDLLLGVLKNTLKVNKSLKVIITSATIDPDELLHYFDADCGSLVKVPGRVYPVSVVWYHTDIHLGWDYLEASVECAYDIHCRKPEGAILVFLTSPSETDEAIDLFERFLKQKKGNTQSKLQPTLLSIHGKLDTEKQLEVFQPVQKGYRKIIFATNSAETSITIPDVVYVVDSGMSKELHYDKDKKRSILVVGFVTRSAAEQRKGRAGRTRPGICYRMYTKRNFYDDMSEHRLPEILRGPLHRAVLQIMQLNLHPLEFDYISAPPKESIRDAWELLKSLGAISGNFLTDTGRKIARLPLEPQLSKLVMEGIKQGIGYETVLIAALVSMSGRVFIRTEENSVEADEKKYHFCLKEGDFGTFLVVFHEWVNLPSNEKTRWCKENFISPKTMHCAEQVVIEVCSLCAEMNMRFRKEFQPTEEFLKKFEPILFDCFSENLCVYSGHDAAGYISPFVGDSLFIHPSSAIIRLGDKLPQFVIYGIILRTSRNFLTNVSPISESTIVNAYRAGKFDLRIDQLKSLQVSPSGIKPVGETVLIRYVLGKQGNNMKALERSVRNVTKCANFHINVSIEKGEITAFVEPQHHTKVLGKLQLIVDSARLDLCNEDMILNLSHSTCCTFALGCGGNVNDVILPGECREVIVTGKDPVKMSRIRSILEKFGTLISCELNKSDSRILSATFKEVSSAETAIIRLRQNKDLAISPGKVNSSPFVDKNLPLYQIHVKWCRLPCRGSGFVEMSNEMDFIEASCKLSSTPVSIGDNYLIFEPERGNTQTLRIQNIPEVASEESVRTALKNNLPSHISIKSIRLVREASEFTSKIQINIQMKRLQQAFSSYSTAQNLYIDVQTPDPKDIMGHATVCFVNFDEGEKALKEQKGKLMLGSQKAELTLALCSKMYCKTGIYRVLKEAIGACEKMYQCVDASSAISVNTNRERTMLSVSCENIRYLADMRKELILLLQGHQILCSENPKLQKLFSSRSRISFEDIERETKTLIKLDSLRKIISVYGTPESWKRAEFYILDRSSTISVMKTKAFYLHGGNLPSGFVKVLYQKYGFDLQRLVEDYNLRNAYIDMSKYQLILQGPLKKIEEAEKHLEEMCSELHEDKAETTSSQEETCPVCFDVITCAESLRLENCGHAICKLCLQLQIKSEIFPVVCVTNGCAKPFVADDFRKIFNTNTDLKKPFANAAFQNYMNRMTLKVRYCPTADCPMVYRVTRREFELVCRGCNNCICTFCHSLFHYGMTCEMFQNTKSDENYPVKAWMSKDSENRKVCPSCSTVMEKDGGCQHVICGHCQQHICWMCLRVFPNSEDVYEHVPICNSLTK